MKITNEQFLDYLDSPWYYNIKYNTPIPTDERTLRSFLHDIAYAFLGSIYQKEIIGVPEMTQMLDNYLNIAPHRINNKDVLKGINYLSSLYEYAKDEQLNIISIGHSHVLEFDSGEIEVDIGPIAYRNGKYFLFYPVFSHTFSQEECDSNINCTLHWKAAYDAFDFQLSGVMFYYAKTRKTFIAYRDISSIERLNFIANNVLRGIEQKIFFPVREESSKSRFIPELSRTFTGK